MDRTYNHNIWTTNNGYMTSESNLFTSGNHSINNGDSASRQIITNSMHSGNGLHSNLPNPVTRIPNSKFPLYNSHLIGIQSKFRRKYYHKVLLGLLIFIIVGLLIAVIVLGVNLSNFGNICRSQECLRTAASLIYSMDEQTDPCEDFYQFTCGKWGDEHPRPDSATSNDWFRERQTRVMHVLRQFLKTNVTKQEPLAVGKAKIMYKSCINTTLLDEKGLEPLLNFLREFKLPIIPSAINITLSSEKASKYNNTEEFNWLESLVSIKKNLGMDLVIGFDVFPDPLNRSLNRFALGTPETDSALPFNKDENHKLLLKVRKKTIFKEDTNDDSDDIEGKEEEEAASTKETSSGLIAYVIYVQRILEIFLEYLNSDLEMESMEEHFQSLAMKAVKVARRLYRMKEEAENSTKTSKNPIDDILYITLNELQNLTDKLIAPKTLPIWKPYLTSMMNETKNLKLVLEDDFKIITSTADILYLQNLVEYISETPKAHLEFYIWLSAVEELVLHTTSDMRLLHSEYMKTVVGTEGSSPRSIYCAHAVNTLMGMAVSYGLVDNHFEKYKLPKVRRMLQDIRRAFNNLVWATSWMDKQTKQVTLLKSKEMKSFIGYPEWIQNSTAMDELYGGFDVNISTHLENMIGVLKWRMHSRLLNFHEPEPPGWATSPSNVNAFHTFQSNAITIPIAILQYPFYDLGLEALNYGSIGTILGHELTHGFDDSGRMFDKDGNMLQWWTNETITEYVNRTECFIEQYGHYYLDDIGAYIDGDLTLGENIADNGGMREAFYAYRLYIKDEGKEKFRLPGLEKYSHEQLFFISFGNLWCETYTPAASRYALEDSHCPGKIRLRGVLSNSKEFADTFKCPKGSGMNPDQPKCRLW